MIKTFLNIIRWKELLYLIFVLFLFKYCFFYGYGFKTTLSFLDLGILCLSGALILSSGRLFNYYFYPEKNKKTNIFHKKIKPLALICVSTGLLVGCVISLKIQKPFHIFIFILCSLLVFIHSKLNREKTFFKNLIKSSLNSFVVLLVCWVDFPKNVSSLQLDIFLQLQTIVVLYIIISFLSNTVREIILDVNNINEDNNNNYKTLPIVLGRRRAKNIVMTITIIICVIILSIILLYVESTYIQAVIIALGTTPQLIFIYYLIGASSSSDYKFLLKILNIGFILAYISIPIISYHLKHVI